MPDPNPRTERLHALDSLRAIMMMLGLVLHSAVTYGDLDLGSAWSLKDPDTTSQWFDLLSGYIHAFRMPISSPSAVSSGLCSSTSGRHGQW